jgi:hypothetical protein
MKPMTYKKYLITIEKMKDNTHLLGTRFYEWIIIPKPDTKISWKSISGINLCDNKKQVYSIIKKYINKRL